MRSRPRSRLVAGFVAGFVAAGFPVLAGQSRSAQLVQAARQHMAVNQFDSADATLRSALVDATYLMDSVSVFVWRGILDRLRGSDSLARLNFRQALILNSATSVRGLDQISPGLGELFDAEARRVRIYPAADLEQQPAWSAGPAVVYPPELRRRGVAGLAVVQVVVDTLGHVEPQSIQVLETPDSGLVLPLMQMMVATTFTPGRAAGHAVRSMTSLSFNVMPPAAPSLSATQLASAARTQLTARRPDSALALVTDALGPATRATPGERVYALLVQGLALRALGRDSLASVAFDSGSAGYRDLVARGVDLAPFLRRLADSVRMGRRRGVAPAAATTGLGAPSVTGVDEQPVVATHPAIRYAPEMQALRIGGTVIVEATLDTTGHVIPGSARIVQSPNPVFNEEARRVVLAATYRPARQGGRAVRTTFRQPITFAPY
jgi:TonB family protein